MQIDVVSSLIRLHAVERSDQVATYAQIAAAVDRCRSALAAAQMKVKTNSALGSLFAKADRLLRTWVAGTNFGDIILLIEVDEAYRIAQAVSAALTDLGAHAAIRRITKCCRKPLKPPGRLLPWP